MAGGSSSSQCTARIGGGACRSWKPGPDRTQPSHTAELGRRAVGRARAQQCRSQARDLHSIHPPKHKKRSPCPAALSHKPASSQQSQHKPRSHTHTHTPRRHATQHSGVHSESESEQSPSQLSPHFLYWASISASSAQREVSLSLHREDCEEEKHPRRSCQQGLGQQHHEKGKLAKRTRGTEFTRAHTKGR